MSQETEENLDFIREIIRDDVNSAKHDGRVVTRFPPEPNGFLHIGHAKAICLDFGVAQEFQGRCNLRFDDTNPVTEETRFAESIQRDIEWLGFSWDALLHASDYFEQLREYAVKLIKDGHAFVDSCTGEQIREMRGVPGVPGKDSPFRTRSVEENLALFEQMRAGELDEGACVLRAKIDMASPNFNMRDPILYRIRKVAHHRTGDAWNIYPLYDYAHALSDAIEGITHSLCTLEFEDHRPLYDWVVAKAGTPHVPRQIEFARLELDYTITSKRKLKRLVDEGHVHGWDDPRMPTLAGLRRRGVPPSAIRNLCERVGVAKNNSTVEMVLFDHCIREELERVAPRVLGVLDPLEVVIENMEEGEEIELDAPFHPADPSHGSRKLVLTRKIVIDRADFMVDPPKKFFRLGPGREVRLRYACIIQCHGHETNEAGEVARLKCTLDRATLGGAAPEGRKVKGTIHWVSPAHGFEAEVRVYDRLFAVPDPGGEDRDIVGDLNPESLVTIPRAVLEGSLASAKPGQVFQFERTGYFTPDEETSADKPVFNRTIGLRDSWAKIAGKGA